MKQGVNPILPLSEYIPDGEPHVFGDRIYLFGSHDKEGGSRYCEEGNYVLWSAPLSAPTQWVCHGEIYSARQDPRYPEGEIMDLYAPDVVQGNDGRFYLYYNLTDPEHGMNGFCSVAAADRVTGPYRYHGVVRNADGTPYNTYLMGDPAVLNDNGVIRLYTGWSLSMVAGEAHAQGDGYQGEQRYQAPPRQAVQMPRPGTPAMAAAIRKINGLYYFIYSSENSHELCYAVSPYPDRDFAYGGTIISNGDVGFEGLPKEQRANMTANDHGSLERINGQWYIFHHRQTHGTTFSRQACAEQVTILPDGSIPQVRGTSMGLNPGPLKAEGRYPAPISCVLTNGRMPHATNTKVNGDFPRITNIGEERFIAGIKDGTRIGYR